MRVLTHLDPLVLERAVLERVERARATDRPAHVLVVVPTRRLADHVQRRLARESAAWLGVEILHFNVLARRILELPGSRAVRLLSSRLQRALLQQQLPRMAGNPWALFVGSRPGGARGLLRSLRDLREAGIPVKAVEAAAENDSERGLAEVYGKYVAALRRLEKRGLVDDAGWVEAALPGAPRYAARFDSILLYGAYELIGIQLRLLHALDRHDRVTALVPMQADRPVSNYAERWVRRHLLDGEVAPETLAGDVEDSRTARWAALYDERSTPPAAAAGTFTLRSTQGAAAEVRVALRRALRAVADGCPAEEIVIAARSLTPYAPALEEAFADEGLPWESSLSHPLRRQGVARDFLLLLRVLADDFPRRQTAELLGSTRLHWSRLTGDGRAIRGGRADYWSRRARILGGLDEWCAELPEWAGNSTLRRKASDDPDGEARQRAARRELEARRLGEVLRALRQRVDPKGAATWSEHAGVLEELLDTLFEPAAKEGQARALAALRTIVLELRLLDRLDRDGRRVSFERLRGWVEDAVRSTELPLHDSARGGIRVVDAMQLRGMTCRRLFLLGMNAGIFPRPPREDPILDDTLRRRLAERTGRPLAIKSRGVEEERLLLLQMLGAGRAVELSWQRADEAGRARTPSLALREVARLMHGRPDLRALRDDVERISSHPSQQIEQLESGSGLLSPADRLLLAALRTSGPHSNRALAQRYPELEPGLRMLRATESFREADPAYDGRVGPPPAEPRFSPSGLELLGTCPLKYFFFRVLRVRELDEEASPFVLAPPEIGIRVHELLESIYAALRDEGLFDPPLDASRLLRRARQLLTERGEGFIGALGPRISRRYPVLWEQLSAEWVGAIRAFVEYDLQTIADDNRRPVEFEAERERSLDLGREASLLLRGRLDRILEADGLLVGDYKTSRSLERYGNFAYMLQGSKLQAPLYRMLCDGPARVELLGVGPQHVPGEEASRVVFDGFDSEDQESGFLESLRVLARLSETGVYPFNKDKHCEWCAYNQACRRDHPPSYEREKLATDSDEYRLVQKKTAKQKPTLAAVRQDLEKRRNRRRQG